jgi:hypothetical protein
LGTIGLCIELILSASCSGRAAAYVLQMLAQFLPGLPETPCANSARAWIFRLGLYELTCAKETADDWVWLVDHTVQLGMHKGMIVVGLRLSVWQQAPRPLQHEDVRLLYLEPVERSNGEKVQEQLEKVAAKTGVPRAIVSDGGSDLKRGVSLFCKTHPKVAHTYDIKHKMALLLKKELEGDQEWGQFVYQSNLARRGVTLTSAAFLVPPCLSAKARYMNVDRLVAWGQKVLEYLDHPREVPGLTVDPELVETRLGWLREYRYRLAEWSGLLALAEASEHYVRHQGLHCRAAEELRLKLDRLPVGPRGGRMKEAILEFISQQSCVARPGERLIGSTEVLESIIGKYKRLQSMHSAGGMTGMILSIGAIVGRRSLDALRTALTTAANNHVWQWCRENLGLTLQSQRKLALPSEQKQDQPRLAHAQHF